MGTKKVIKRKKTISSSSTDKKKNTRVIAAPKKATSLNEKPVKIIKKKKVVKQQPTANTKTPQIKSRIEKTKKKSILTPIVEIIATIFCVLAVVVTYAVLGTRVAFLAALLLIIIIGILYILTAGRKRRKLLTILLIFMLIIGIAGISVFATFCMYIKKEADPLFITSNLNTREISRLYDMAGVEYATLGSENREKVTYDQLPEVLVDAIVATEDTRYFKHNGFDAPRFIMAAIGQVLGKRGAGGASTLTMQVVKNSFTDPEGKKDSGKEGIIRKFEDIYLAMFKLEKEYSKQQIIEFYVNNHFLGGNIYGVEEASETYFGKPVTDLNLSEAAILAGMFKSPNAYKPTAHPEEAAKRRRTVLYLMKIHGYITEQEELWANSIPVESLVADQSNVTENEYQGYIDTVVEEVKEKYGVNPYTTPLLVYTNLDRGKQLAVASVLKGETYDWIDDRVQSGVAVVDTPTGKILAIGNGRSINGRSNSQTRQYNYATQIKRQPGSSAKPLFDYGPGIEYNDWSTYQLFDDTPYSYSNGRSIKNWDGGYYGTITLRRALSTSRNIPALKAFQQVENSKIREFVTGLGINPELCVSGYTYNRDQNKCINNKDKNDTQEPSNLHEAHSIGAFTGVSPLEMASAYAAFSNGGYYNEPYSVSKIVFRQTKSEQIHKEVKRKVMSDATAFMISSVLQDVQLTGGTPHNIACKTGTTNFDDNTMNNYNMPGDAIRDSWVVGYSTKTAIGMWYGYDSFTKESIAEGYVLHNIPATIQKDRLFNALVANGVIEANREDFIAPASVTKVGVSAGSNPPKLVGTASTGAYYEYFKKGTEPTEKDDMKENLPKPANFKVTLTGTKVSMSWSPTDPGQGEANYGTWGYNIYKDGTLIDWTDKTSYSFNTTTPYGIYTIVGTYQNYNGLKTNPASYTLEEKKPKPSPSPSPSTSPSPTETTPPSPSPTTEEPEETPPTP